MTIKDIRQLIQSGDTHPFYVAKEWRRLQKKVLADDKGECQLCKAKGKYAPACIVHHVKHLKQHPELALSKYYVDADGNLQRNLISVCRRCHETVCHPERIKYKQFKPKKKPLTDERW